MRFAYSKNKNTMNISLIYYEGIPFYVLSKLIYLVLYSENIKFVSSTIEEESIVKIVIIALIIKKLFFHLGRELRTV